MRKQKVLQNKIRNVTELGNVHYLMACAQCQMYWPEDALKSLECAGRCGWINYKAMDAEKLLEYLRTGFVNFKGTVTNRISDKEMIARYKRVRYAMKQAVDSEGFSYSSNLIDQDPIFKDAKVRELFDKFDADGNGTIDRHEFTSMISQLLEISDEQVNVLIQAVDEDRNGIIDIQEFKYFVNRYASAFESERTLDNMETTDFEEQEVDTDGWHWSEKQASKSDAIKIKLRNPAVFTATPLNSDVNRFRCQIVSLGTWIAIGIADRTEFQVTGGAVLGGQEQTFNCCVFSQNKSSLKSSENTSIHLGDPLSVGDFIDIQVDFVNQKVKFWKNLIFQGEITASKYKIGEELVAPVVSLSVGTEVLIKNELPPLPEDQEQGLNSLKRGITVAIEELSKEPRSSDSFGGNQTPLLTHDSSFTPRIPPEIPVMISPDELEYIKKTIQNPQVSAKLKKLEELLQQTNKYFKVSDAELVVRTLVGGNFETKVQAALMFEGRLVGNVHALFNELFMPVSQKIATHAKLGIGIPTEFIKAKNIPHPLLEREISEPEFKILRETFQKYSKAERTVWLEQLLTEHSSMYLDYLHVNNLLDLMEQKERPPLLTFLATNKKIISKFVNNLNVLIYKLPEKIKPEMSALLANNWKKSPNKDRPTVHI